MEAQSDIERLQIDDILREKVQKSDIELALIEAQNGAVEDQDTFAIQVLSLLIDCVRLPFYPKNKNEPFGNLLSVQAGGRFTIGKISPEEQQQITTLVHNIKNPFLKARLGDLLWELCRDYKAANIAVTSHLEQAAAIKSLSWLEEIGHLTRAASLSKILNKKGEFHRQVLQEIKTLTNDVDPTQSNLRALKLWTLLAEFRGDEFSHLSQAAAAYAEKQQELGKFSIARGYWLFASELAQSTQDSTLHTTAIVAAAETYVSEATAYAKDTSLYTNFHHASHSLKKAIEILRTARNSQERVSQLKIQLAEYQQKSTEQMFTNSFSFDLSETASEIDTLLNNQTLELALYRLGQLIPLMNKTQTIETARQARERDFLRSLFPRVYQSHQGKIIAHEPTDPEESILSDALHSIRQHQIIYAQLIRYCVFKITEEYYIDLSDIANIIYGHPLVQERRILSISKGLLAGFNNDFIVAVHLLIPQMENSVRILLNKLKIPTTGLSLTEIQDEFSLNTLLTDERFVPTLEQTLGEDWVFTLRATLVERYGTNTRNNFAHGLVDDFVYMEAEGVYVWALAWKLYCILLGKLPEIEESLF